jgi:hypothetical protein
MEKWSGPGPTLAYVIGAALRPAKGSAPGWAVACVLKQRGGEQVAQLGTRHAVPGGDQV